MEVLASIFIKGIMPLEKITKNINEVKVEDLIEAYNNTVDAFNQLYENFVQFNKGPKEIAPPVDFNRSPDFFIPKGCRLIIINNTEEDLRLWKRDGFPEGVEGKVIT